MAKPPEGAKRPSSRPFSSICHMLHLPLCGMLLGLAVSQRANWPWADDITMQLNQLINRPAGY